MFKYAGIGSRSTPPDILETMTKIGKSLAERGWTLRSGGADGADLAFEKGCDEANGTKEIFLPWKKFNKSTSPLFDVSDEAKQLASTLHPAWDNCNDAARRLHGRNCYQILGKNLDDPVCMVVCWTMGGGITGGTATAIKLGKKHNARIFNLAVDTEKTLEELREFIKENENKTLQHQNI
jgi:hypothetical protein